MNNEEYVYLDNLNLPNIRMYKDGSMFDERQNLPVYDQQISGHVETVSPVTNERVRFSYDRVYGANFRAPWVVDPVVDYKWLGPIGFSHYYATRSGRIYSDITQNYLIGNMSFDGYVRALLKRDSGGFVTIGIHRLVAMVYLPNPESKPEVNHKNGNKLDNSVDNLEWVWGWENVDHARKSGLRKFVLSDDVIREICVRLERGDMVKTICSELNVSKHSVLGIKSGCHYRISKEYNIPRNRHF